MNPPVAPLKRLTLETMPPTLRLSVPVEENRPEAVRDERDSQTSESDSDDNSSVSEEEEEDSDQVRSPTRLVYNLEALPEKTKSTVRDAFNEPPQMVVQHCRQVGDTFAFQMSEVVTRSVRIRAPSNGEARMSCSCAQGARKDEKEPCQHILWLLDQLVKQTLYDTDHEQPLTMTSAGFPEEMGDPFRAISDHHLNIVADGLHCRYVDPDGYDPRQVDQLRIQESRELLSSVYQSSPYSFRPDIFDEPLLGPPIVKAKDLDYTVFRMLVDDDNFFHYFLSEATRGSDVIQQFRLLSHRINAVLQDFDQHNLDNSDNGSNTPRGSHTVAWAARHIQGVISLIRYAIWSGERPLKAAEKDAAAKALIHILSSVVRRYDRNLFGGRRQERNLYLRFIGDVDCGFILNELELIPEGALLYIHNLEMVLNDICVNGAIDTYVNRFRKFIAQLKARGPSLSLKREGPSDEDNEGAFKRMR
ncbi:hypothetical protein NLG97_g1301 [Lecanicillium saksenae]|uniref:Uncharacterized protein n=1 Tax=Lecanicillium saksenae TaxID=468837 RepID=A0ACC1R453_9HYPO|nr:hypothetical protein NLG97_g1301 [Lecanicillium saksenae]